MTSLSGPLRRHLPGLVALLLVIGGLFAVTVVVRLPWMHCLSPEEPCDFLTGIAVRTVNEWLEEGPWESGLRIYAFPKVLDPELPPYLGYEEVFPGYAPGLYVPLYLYCLATGQRCHTAPVMAYGMLCHFFTALFLAWLVYFCAVYVKTPRTAAALLGIVPGVLALLAPAAIYYFQKTYFADIQVLVLYPACVMLEVLWDMARSQGDRSAQRVIAGLQAVTVFCGVMTEWLFGTLLVVLLAKRFLLDREGKSLRETAWSAMPLVAPATVAMILFIAWVLSLFGPMGILVMAGKFLSHSGLVSDQQQPVERFHSIFWGARMPEAFGGLGTGLIYGSIAVSAAMTIGCGIYRFASGRSRSLAVRFAFYTLLLWAPCVMHTLVLREHSLENAFAVAKYVAPLATLPFALLPLTVVAFLQPGSDAPIREPRRPSWHFALVFVLLAAGSAAAAAQFPRYRQFYKPCAPYEEIAEIVREHTTRDDAIFGWAPWGCGRALNDLFKYTSYSERIIMPVGTINEIAERLKPVHRDPKVFLMPLVSEGFPEMVQPIAHLAIDQVQYGDFQLLQFRKQDLLALPQSVPVAKP